MDRKQIHRDPALPKFNDKPAGLEVHEELEKGISSIWRSTRRIFGMSKSNLRILLILILVIVISVAVSVGVYLL